MQEISDGWPSKSWPQSSSGCQGYRHWPLHLPASETAEGLSSHTSSLRNSQVLNSSPGLKELRWFLWWLSWDAIVFWGHRGLMLNSADLEAWFGQVSLEESGPGKPIHIIQYLREWRVNQTTNFLIYSGRSHSHDWNSVFSSQGNHLLISSSLEIKLEFGCIFLSFESEQREFDGTYLI